MTYDAQEISLADGQPVEFYEFTLGPNQYNYTSAEDDIVIGAITYTAIAISRSNIALGSESAQEVLTITMPSNLAPADEYISVVPGQICNLDIHRYHRTDAGLELITIFKGLLRSVAYTDNGYNADISLVPVNNGFNREVPRYTYQSLCNNILYDNKCSVSQSSYQYTEQVTDVTGATITVAGLAGHGTYTDGYFTGGFVQLGTTDWRLIIDHNGTTGILTLLLPFQNSPLGSNVDVFAGCDHTMPVCVSKFSNGANFFGFSFIPTRNIFRSGIK